MSHRLLGITILLALAGVALLTGRMLGGKHFFTRVTAVWLALGLGQLLLGAWTVWSNKAADVATAHVTLGSLLLAVGGLLTALAFAPQDFSPSVQRSTSHLHRDVRSVRNEA
jgi:cytochrome c oxidase assembly protein subunit 15